MKLKNLLLIGSAALAMGTLTAHAASEGPTGRLETTHKLVIHQPQDVGTADIRSQFIVALEARGTDLHKVVEDLRETYPIEVTEALTSTFSTLVVECNLETAQRLAVDYRVRFVEQNIAIETAERVDGFSEKGVVLGLSAPPVCLRDSGNFRLDPYPSSMPTIPWGAKCPNHSSCVGNWGLDRIDDRLQRDGTYQPESGPHLVDVFMIDYGVDLDHEELSQTPADETQIVGGTSLYPYHGAHVAGILVGKNFGVAQSGVRFHSLNRGSDSVSALVRAFEEVLLRKMPGVPAVVSLSSNAGLLPSSPAISDVVRGLVAEGIVVVNSAGNVRTSNSVPISCDDVLQDPSHSAENFSLSGDLYPPDVLVVGAMGDDDSIYCECGDLNQRQYDCASRPGSVDLYAPGVNIVSMSAEHDQAICRLSGTSMAAPHAAGAAALLLSRFPNASPGAVQRALRRASTQGVIVDHHGQPVVANNRLLYTGPYTSNIPVAGQQYVFALAGETVSIPKTELLADDFDWEGRSIRFVEVKDAWNGQVVERRSTVEFTVDPGTPPSTNTYRSASFRYVISNGLATDEASVNVVVLPSSLGDDELVWGGSGSADIDLSLLLANDGLTTAADCLAPLTSATAGTVTQRFAGGECIGYRYTPPNPNFAGTDTFEYVLSLQSGGQVQARVTFRYNDPAYPTPVQGPVLAQYPGHLTQGPVISPSGAYLLSWPVSNHTGITEYRLSETPDRARSTVIYSGDRTFFAVSGRNDGLREYTVQACTPVACSTPSPFVRPPIGSTGVPTSNVNTVLSSCTPSTGCDPSRGLWYGPDVSGSAGIDLGSDSSGRWRTVLFSHRQADNTPIWYSAKPAYLSGSKMIAVLEELNSTGSLQVSSEQFGFLELDLTSNDIATMTVYRFDNIQHGDHGFENPVLQGVYYHLAGMNTGVTGQWRPAPGAHWGMVITQLPSASDGSTKPHTTTYFFRPDGTPTWVSTQTGTTIPQPFALYQGTASLLHRTGTNQCLECTGNSTWDDTYLGSAYISIQSPLSASSGYVEVNVPIGSNVDPAFPAGYSFTYNGTMIKVTD